MTKRPTIPTLEELALKLYLALSRVSALEELIVTQIGDDSLSELKEGVAYNNNQSARLYQRLIELEGRLEVLERNLKKIIILLQATQAMYRPNETFLYQLLNEKFSDEDLRQLAYLLHINYSNIPGQTHVQRCMELVILTSNLGRLRELKNMMTEMRPNLSDSINQH